MSNTALNLPGPRVKRAIAGGDQDTSFEQTFSSLAYAYLKDKAPRLLDYIVGFQLVDRNDDSTQAVGIFGFKVGPQWLYAPVFFLSGDLKGHELLYIKNQDMFVPLKENWVNYIMSRKPHVLGEGSPDTQELGGMMPNLQDMTDPPSDMKYGSDRRYARVKQAVSRGCRNRPDEIDSWARPGLSAFAAGMSKRAEFLFGPQARGHELDVEKLAEAPFQAALAGAQPDLEGVLQKHGHLVEPTYDLYQHYPAVKQGIDKFHPGMFQRLARHWSNQVKEAKERRGSLLEGRPQNSGLICRSTSRNKTASLVPEEPQPDPSRKIRIWTQDDLLKSARLVNDGRQEVTSHGYLVEDERTGDEISVAYKPDVSASLTNPDGTGIYKILERPGSFIRALVANNPMTNAGRENMVTLVSLDNEGENKSYLNAHRTAIWAGDQADESGDSRDDYESWFENLGSGSLSKGGTYIAVGPRGSATTPFHVREKYRDGAYRVDFEDGVSIQFERSDHLPTLDDWGSYSHGHPKVSTFDAKLYVDPEGHEGSELRAVSGDLYVPGEFKFVRLKSPPEYDEDEIPLPEDRGASDPRPIEPGRMEDLQILFASGTDQLKLNGDNNEVIIETEKRGQEKLPWRKALFSLIQNHGLSEKTAESLLRDTQVHGSNKCRIKYAIGFPGGGQLAGQGPRAPMMPRTDRGSTQVGNRTYPATFSTENTEKVPGMEAGLTDRSIYDPFRTPDQGLLMMAQQAGQQDQKEVFDTSVISNLLRTTSDENLVGQHLGDLMKATDRLGRLLFQMYWHQDRFAERYGDQDLPELEDSLRNAFLAVGDVVLYLKEKSVEAPMSDNEEPSLDDVST